METDSFGNRVRLIRKAIGCSQKEFAGLCGLSSGAISDIESGNRNPPFDALLRICHLGAEHGISADLLLLGADRPYPDLSADRVLLLELYDQLTDFERGELVGSLRTRLENRSEGAG